LCLVSKQNLNSSYWYIWHIKNDQQWNKIEKVKTSQNKKTQKLKNNNPPNNTKTDSLTLKK